MTYERIVVILASLFVHFYCLRRACVAVCTPPTNKKEKKELHIIKANNLFERFCTDHYPWTLRGDRDEIVLEGYYPCCIMLSFAMIIAFALIAHLSYETFDLTWWTSIVYIVPVWLKKPILKLSRKCFKKQISRRSRL